MSCGISSIAKKSFNKNNKIMIFQIIDLFREKIKINTYLRIYLIKT